MGGRTGGLKSHLLPLQFRERKVQEYAGYAVQIYLDRAVFPSGRSVALPGFDEGLARGVFARVWLRAFSLNAVPSLPSGLEVIHH